MASFSGLGIGLSLVFGCLVLALFAELYYLLWWKKKRVLITRQVEVDQLEEEDHSKYIAKELFHLICWKKPNSSDNHENPQFEEQDLELGGTNKDLLIKAFNGDESIESELMRLHNLSGPPRFLFTIKEETKEDLESEDGMLKSSRKGSRTTSLSDLILAVDSPYHNHQGFNNPLFESSSSSTSMEFSEINKLRSSPPPKFKFLRDAEEKLFRKLMEENERRLIEESSSTAVKLGGESENKARMMVTGETEGSFLGFIVGKSNNCTIFNQVPVTSSQSQVLPLASSPTAFTVPFDHKKPNIVH